MNTLVLFYSPYHTALFIFLCITFLGVILNEFAYLQKRHLMVLTILGTLCMLVRNVSISTVIALFVVSSIALFIKKEHRLLKILIFSLAVGLYITDILVIHNPIESVSEIYLAYILLMLVTMPMMLYKVFHMKRPSLSTLLTSSTIISCAILLIELSNIRNQIVSNIYGSFFLLLVTFTFVAMTVHNADILISVQRVSAFFERYTPYARTLLTKSLSFYSNKRHLAALIGSSCMMIITYPYIYYMGKLATTLAGTTPISDQLHNILPFYDTSFIHLGVFGYFRDIALFLLMFFAHKIPLYLVSLSLLSITRSTLVTITNLAPPAGQPVILSSYTFGGDLFFSGHVAISFLTALIFSDHKILRNIAFVFSFIFGLESLVGRFHYSIDVLAAPFIAYGIFALTMRLFPTLATWAFKKENASSVTVRNESR